MVAKKSASVSKAENQQSKSVKTTAPKSAKNVKLEKKPSKKVVQKKKTVRKKAAPKKPIITPAMFEEYYFKISQDKFKELSKEWNETKLKIKIPKLDGYDHWLNFFKTLTPSAIKQLAVTGVDFLPTEGYAALAWWHDVIGSPYRMDKIHKAGLTSGDDGTKKQSVQELATANDRIGVLKAIRDSIAQKLDKGAGSRDTAALAREMTEIMTQIADFEKRQGPKKETKLGQLLGEFDASKAKQAKAGSRKTSYKAKVTIKDVEGE